MLQRVGLGQQVSSLSIEGEYLFYGSCLIQFDEAFADLISVFANESQIKHGSLRPLGIRSAAVLDLSYGRMGGGGEND
jgi:hypothetical protein